MVSFRVLGPVEVVEAMETYVPRIPLRAALLALLAVEGNRLVETGRLVDTLWDNSPRSAAANVRTHVAGLRGAFDRLLPDSSRLETVRGSGYRLVVGPDEVDFGEFKRLAAAARWNLRAGDADLAGLQCRRALGLFRGRFGQGLPVTDRLTARAVAVDGARLEVVEDLTASRLLLGDHQGLGSELRVVLSEVPERERLWFALMAVQQLGGSGTCALSTFDRCREHFCDELGLDVPPAMVDLRLAVLNRDDGGALDLIRRELLR